jgi:hypothetical protein
MSASIGRLVPRQEAFAVKVDCKAYGERSSARNGPQSIMSSKTTSSSHALAVLEIADLKFARQG